ncbi:MAG: hypothetical protein M1457_06000 [bacterium]|nr:hypothetical protein [bacterium]
MKGASTSTAEIKWDYVTRPESQHGDWANIWVQLDDGSGYADLNSYPLTSLDPADWHYPLPDLDIGILYYVRLRYTVNYIDGYSNGYWACPLPTPPEFDSVELNGQNSVDIEWHTDDSTEYLNGFNIYRTVEGCDEELVEYYAPWETEACDGGLLYHDPSVELKTIDYRIVAFNYMYEPSEDDPELHVTVPTVLFAPASPYVVSVDNTIVVHWTDVSQENEGFDIYRQEGENYAYWAYRGSANSGTATQFVDDYLLQHGQTYRYKVMSTRSGSPTCASPMSVSSADVTYEGW